MMSKEQFNGLDKQGQLNALLLNLADEEAIFSGAVGEMERIGKWLQKDAYVPFTPEQRKAEIETWKQALIRSLRSDDD